VPLRLGFFHAEQRGQNAVKRIKIAFTAFLLSKTPFFKELFHAITKENLNFALRIYILHIQ
jgi:hypothetical protein